MPPRNLPSEGRGKLLLASAVGPVQRALAALRALPWPSPLQRLTARGLARLAQHLPELAELLGEARPSPTRSQGGPSPVASRTPVLELSELLARLGARDFGERVSAAQALASHSDPRATDALVGALRDRSVEVAVAAATSLAMSGSGGATRALLAVLDDTEGFHHPLVRAAAVHGLGQLLPRHDRAPLVRALRDPQAEVSIAAIAALGHHGEVAAPHLLGVLLDASFFLPVTRLAAGRALERLAPYGADALAQAAAREPDPALRALMERLHARVAASTALAE